MVDATGPRWGHHLKDVLKKLRFQQGSLAARTSNAIGWNLGRTGAEFVLRLTSNLIMTRLLMPEAFGVLAFAMTFVTALALLTDIGINQSIVREEGTLSAKFLRTAWTIRILISIGIAICVLLLSASFSLVTPYFDQPDSVLAHPDLPLLIAMTSVIPVFQGFSSTNLPAAVREMKFKRIAAIEISSMAIRIVCQVIFASISPTVWALLFGALVGNFCNSLMSHIFIPGVRMRFCWHKETVMKIWSFGKWITGSSILSFVINNTDKIAFGVAISSTTMGLYVVAFIWISAAQRVLNILVRQVGFPVASEVMRNRSVDARRLLRKYQYIIDLSCIISFAAMVILGPHLVYTLYTPEYSYSGTIIQLLAPILLSVRFQQFNNILMVEGRSSILFGATLVVAIATVIFLNIGLRYDGIEGAVAGMVLARFTSAPILLFSVRKVIGIRNLVFDSAFSLIAATSVIAVYLGT